MNIGSAPSARVQSTAHSNYLYQTTVRQESRQTTTARFSLENAAQAAEARSAKTDFTASTHSVPTSNFTAGTSLVRQSSSAAALKTSAEIPTVSGTDVVSAKDMTMDEYKQYIHDQISQMPFSPSQRQDTISISISEAGFEAMKNDPEYEKWVLDGLRPNFIFNDPWTGICGGGYQVYSFGATKEECNAQGYYPEWNNGMGVARYNAESQNCFWEQRSNLRPNGLNLPKKAAPEKNEKGFWEKRSERQRNFLQRSAELSAERHLLMQQLLMA